MVKKRKYLFRRIGLVVMALIIVAAAYFAIVNKPTEFDEDETAILLLVNRENPVPEGYTVNLAETENGHTVDERMKAPLEKMLADARREGNIPKITQSYRTREDQVAIMEDKINELMSEGLSREQAETKARETVAEPDTSEHQTGLAVDISTADWDKQNAYDLWVWLEKNCAEYGFILRYPENKENITGFSAEPWHFRHVGEKAAKDIMKRKLCLEEFLN